ncbi:MULTISPECIES: MFS transporter [Sporosarcina]|uniref:Predicted arabinose efflux permease, MFS family n=2 Tax=Sporosarcina newyorkensis TaxID=759851 RepID=A0A1T4XQN5_9BACL|nr:MULTISPECIES: MFS transporter [Sporosarcina]EGQ22424.1 multidrug efflux transporter [Sporosarcina newyorkensis 2681]MBY0222424.1 MFS transporter [Sporosarcina aquimarina]SKA91431.1 Predicted arabinose efflux permease, MFS family [Sporosarcina newyorkensis]
MRFFVYLIVFFSFFDLFSQLPVISPFATSLGASSFIVGLSVGIYSFSNVFGNIISGILTDRKGPFYILLFGLLTSALSLFSYALIEGSATLIGVRFLHGLTEGLIVPAAFTFLANGSERSKRGRNAAISGAFVGLAAIFGPAYSGIVSVHTSVVTIMAINGTFMVLLTIGAFLFLRSFTYVRKVKTETQKAVKPLAFFRHPGIIRAFLGAFFLMFSQGVLALVLPLKVEFLQYDAKTTGMLLSVFGFVAVLIFLLPVNRIFDFARPMLTLAIGLFLMSASMLFLSQVDQLSLMLTAMIVYGMGFALLFPSINSLLIDSTKPETRGKAYGFFYAFFSFGVVVGSSAIGILDLGSQHAFMLASGILFLAGVFTVIGLRKDIQPVDKTTTIQ